MGILNTLFKRVNTSVWGRSSIQDGASRVLATGRSALHDAASGYRDAALRHGESTPPIDWLVYTGKRQKVSGKFQAHARAIALSPPDHVEVLWEHDLADEAFGERYWGVAVDDAFLLSSNPGTRLVDTDGRTRWQHGSTLGESPLRLGDELLLVFTGTPSKEWVRISIRDGVILDRGHTLERGAKLLPDAVEIDAAQLARRGSRLGIGDRMRSKPLPDGWKVAYYLGHLDRTPLAWLERARPRGCEVAVGHLTRERNLDELLELGEVRWGGRDYSSITARWVGDLLTIRTTITTGILRGTGILLIDPTPLRILGRVGDRNSVSFIGDGNGMWWKGRI